MTDTLPGGYVSFGPDANCTLSVCPIEYSVYQYRPSLPANIVFLVLFVLLMAVHTYLGIRWRRWGFMVCMILGCLVEIVGYAGRIVLYKNPFDFIGFMIQIVFITVGPVFYTAAVYVTLSQTILALGPELSRIKPSLFYWIFIPSDVLCLILQATGGALSTVSTGSSDTGVNISLGGLGLQVAVLVIFSALFADYLFRFYRSSHLLSAAKASYPRLTWYFAGLGSAIVLILARCAYRCYELSQGYQNSDVITDEGLFIGLEGVLIVVAVACLFIGNPGYAFGKDGVKSRAARTEEGGEEKATPMS